MIAEAHQEVALAESHPTRCAPVPHAGDENAERLDLDIASIARVHGATVIATIVVALVIAARSRRRGDAALQPPIATWLFVGVVQAAVGYVQYFNDVPELLVGIHVAGATAVMWATTQVVLDTTRPHVGDGDDLVSEALSGLVSRP